MPNDKPLSDKVNPEVASSTPPANQPDPMAIMRAGMANETDLHDDSLPGSSVAALHCGSSS